MLGSLVSRERLQRGELQQLIRDLAQRDYAIPGSQRRRLGENTIEAWYYDWRKDGLSGLTPKIRIDRGQSKLSPELQEAVLAAKRDNPSRSLRQIQRLLQLTGVAANTSLSLSAICSAGASLAGRCLRARAPSTPVSCCKTSASAKASPRISLRFIRIMAHR